MYFLVKHFPRNIFTVGICLQSRVSSLGSLVLNGLERCDVALKNLLKEVKDQSGEMKEVVSRPENVKTVDGGQETNLTSSRACIRLLSPRCRGF